eukprot:g4787.t1
MSFKVVKSQTIAPSTLATKTYSLSPIDIFSLASDTYLTWPFFYTYKLDASRVNGALHKVAEKFPLLCGRIRHCPETRYVVEVDPSKSAEFGFSFTEQESELTVAEAILHHSQVKTKSADFPIYPDVPFFMEALDVTGALKGETALFSVKLTHFKDGAALNFTIEHLLVDGQRFLEISRDVSRAYCGLSVSDKDLDRSYIWPDQLVKHYPFLGDAVGQLPRKVAEKKENFGFTGFPDDTCATELLYFSPETLEGMKSVVKPFLKEGDFVSSNDVLLSFCWMLLCELSAKTQPVTNGTELEIANTMASCAIEFIKNGINIIPENYTGNAVLVHFLASTGLEFDGKSIPEVFAMLATTVRGNLTGIKDQPALVAQGLMMYYSIISSGSVPMPMGAFRVAMTNLVKTPIPEIDFGSGPPALAHITIPYPLLGTLMTVGPGPGKDGGILMNIALRGSQEKAFKDSVVVKECAPLVKRIHYDFTVQELDAFLRKK